MRRAGDLAVLAAELIGEVPFAARLAVVVFAVDAFAVARFAVDAFAVARFAVVRLAVARFAVVRLAVEVDVLAPFAADRFVGLSVSGLPAEGALARGRVAGAVDAGLLGLGPVPFAGASGALEAGKPVHTGNSPSCRTCGCCAA